MFKQSKFTFSLKFNFRDRSSRNSLFTLSMLTVQISLWVSKCATPDCYKETVGSKGLITQQYEPLLKHVRSLTINSSLPNDEQPPTKIKKLPTMRKKTNPQCLPVCCFYGLQETLILNTSKRVFIKISAQSKNSSPS